MADITKCLGINCGRKNECYRYTAESNGEFQSWSALELSCIKNGYDFFKEQPLREKIRIQNERTGYLKMTPEERVAQVTKVLEELWAITPDIKFFDLENYKDEFE